MGLRTVPNSVWNVGRATLTTVMSRMDMIAPITTTPAIFRTAPSMWSGRSGSSTLLSEDMWISFGPARQPSPRPRDVPADEDQQDEARQDQREGDEPGRLEQAVRLPGGLQ